MKNRHLTGNVDRRLPAHSTRARIGRISLRGLARFGAGCGWILSLPFALATSLIGVWAARGLWSWLDALAPWTPWPPGQSLGGIALPAPELRPRELLQVERLYLLLTPVERHPTAAVLIATLLLTAAGALAFIATTIGSGLLYNLFARIAGGLEVETNAVRQDEGRLKAPTDEVGDQLLPDPDRLQW